MTYGHSRGLRRSSIALAAISCLASLAACGGGTEGASSAEPASTAGAATVAAPATTQMGDGPWMFTDDRGTEITLDSPPVRIVAEADSAKALYDLGITPVGIFGSAPLGSLPQLADLPLDQIESVGQSWGEINLEKLAAVDPDLIVTAYWPPDGVLWGFKDDKQQELVEEIAPAVGIDYGAAATEAIGRYEELAASVGADVDAPQVAAARERFELAAEALRTAVAANPGLRVMAMSGVPDAMYVANPGSWSELAFFHELGLDIVVPKNPYDEYWEELSWEQVDTYPADVMIIDARVWSDTQGAPDDAFGDIETWQALPAVQAGQVGPWRAGAALSYAEYAKNLDELTALVERSKVVTG